MARATRAPSPHAYRGSIGQTRRRVAHLTHASGDLVPTELVVSIDAVADPELAERLQSDAGVNAVATPVLYHDPAAEVLVLVLAEAHRARELDERIAVLEALRADVAPIPTYAKEFAVVFGGGGLRAYLETRALSTLERARAAQDASRQAAREAELERLRADVAAARAEGERTRLELERVRAETRAAAIARAQVTVATPAPAPTPVAAPAPASRESREELQTNPVAVVAAAGDSGLHSFESVQTGVTPRPDVDLAVDDEPTTAAIIPPGSDPLTTDNADKELDEPDPWLADALLRSTSSFAVQGGHVRLVLLTDAEGARNLRGHLDVRVLLYRTPDAPVVALLVGPPAALRVPVPRQVIALTLDVGVDSDRQVLLALSKRFVLDVEIAAGGVRERHVELSAPLADNVGYVVRAADDHLRGVSADGEPSFARAVERVLAPGFDLFGTAHADATEFRDDKLAGLETAAKLRRAIAVARRFARPSREDYLVCTRGFPLPRWRELRRHVLDSAVTWGLWMGPELAQVAVSEGLARSRRDLIAKLDAGFQALRQHPSAFDLDDEAAADNEKALADEARALGVERAAARDSTPAITSSDDASVVSGSIGTNSAPVKSKPEPAPANGPTISILQTPKAMRAADDLIAMLESREHRLGAALELCDRQIAVAAPKILEAVTKMSRSDAVRVLGMSVKLGEAARAPLIAQLHSNKAYLRQGAALAVAMLRHEEGTQAVIELLLTEPTDIWREVARAVGQVGATALMPLASHYGRLGDRATPQHAERVAWAMAHVGVRGGKGAIETMANGASVVAPVARKALELLALAANDQVSGKPGDAPNANRDVTVNRAFSRQFFQAVAAGNPEAGKEALAQLDASSPMEMLDEDDLIEDEGGAEDEEALDESDLLQP